MLILQNISKHFSFGNRAVSVLKDISLNIYRGEIIGLLGPSGAGKSTLLQIAGLLEEPDQGKVLVDDVDMLKETDSVKAKVRNQRIGFVYQSHRLLNDFSAIENVMLPALIGGVDKEQAQERSFSLMKKVGLENRLHHRPAKLSGGEQQRVAVARALINRPSILLADEPTGNLDTHTSQVVFDLLLTMARKENISALVATHNAALAQQMDRVIFLQDGHIVAS